MRMHLTHHQMIWEKYLPLVEFSYNNGYQESLRMSLFEALYGQIFKTPISWSDPVNMVLIGHDMLVEMEQEMQVINKNLKATQDSKKSYVYQHRAFKDFQFGEHVYFFIKPRTSSLRIGSCAKLVSRYCGPFNILKRIGLMAYKLELSLTMKSHDVFHVSLLKRYVNDVNHVIDWYILQVEPKVEFH